MKENKQQQQKSKLSKKKLIDLLDQPPPPKSASPINERTPSEFSPAVSASSETVSASDLAASSSIITEIEEEEALGVSVEPFGFNDLKFESEFLTSPEYELSEAVDLDVGLLAAELVAEHLKEARNHVLQAKDLELTSKKLLNRLIEVIISEEFSDLREKVGNSSEVLSLKLATTVLFTLLLIIVACAVFFSTYRTQNFFHGPLPT